MVSSINLDTLNETLWDYSENKQNLTSGNNVIVGGSGNDTISVTGDYNTVNSGDGDDNVVCIGDYSEIDGGEGENIISSKGSNAKITTGNGNNTINTDGSYNSVSAGNGNNEILSYGDYNNIDCKNGNNLIFSNGNYNAISTGDGKDNIVALGDCNEIYSGAGNDRISSIGNYNIIDAGDGNDTIRFLGAGNYIDGGNGDDIISDMNVGTNANIDTWGQGVWGDPHYQIKAVNGQEITFDHKGIAGDTYNVFSGDGIEVDGLYSPWGENPCVITKSTISVGASKIEFDVNGKAKMNGQDINQGTYTLKDGTIITISNDSLSITTRDGNSKIDIKTTSNQWMTIDPSGDFTNVGGIIGKAISGNKPLTEEESEAFNLKNRENYNPFN